MKVIHYKVFESDEAFSEWQLVEQRVIHTVSPFIQSFDMGFESATDVAEDVSTKGGATTSVGCFVTYLEEVVQDSELD